MTSSRIFLLSPATAHGPKARTLVEDPPRTPAARRLHTPGAMSLGALFSHLSGLYFTGKLAYARAFAQPPAALAGRGTYVLTFTHGLLDPDTPVDPEMLRQFRRAGEHDPGTVAREPLVASARELGRRLGDPHCEVVLLGSVQSSKYTEALEPVFGERLRIPRELVRRGHLQRGGLLLECATSGQELEYVGLDELRVILASGRRRR
jgi:hypothetical protein